MVSVLSEQTSYWLILARSNLTIKESVMTLQHTELPEFSLLTPLSKTGRLDHLILKVLMLMLPLFILFAITTSNECEASEPVSRIASYTPAKYISNASHCNKVLTHIVSKSRATGSSLQGTQRVSTSALICNALLNVKGVYNTKQVFVQIHYNHEAGSYRY